MYMYFEIKLIELIASSYVWCYMYLLERADNLALFILDIGAAISVGDIITKHLNVEHINKMHASLGHVFRHFSNYYWRTNTSSSNTAVVQRMYTKMLFFTIKCE